MMTWQIRPLSSRTLPPEWASLHAEKGHVLVSPAFMSPLLSTFARTEIFCAEGREAGQLRCLLLLERCGVGRWQSWQASQAPMTLGLGLERVSPEDWQTLCRALPGFPALLSVVHLDPHEVPRPSEAASLASLDYIRTAWVELPADFENWWAARGKNLRQNINKCFNRLERDGLTPVLKRLRAPAEMAAAVAQYGRIEAASWKADGGTAITPDNDQGLFYTRLLESFAAANAAEVWQLWYGERCVASDLCIEDQGQLIILKTTYDEAEAKTSPAQLMRYLAFRELAAEQRIKRIEFFGKMMEWHGRLTDQSRVLYHLNVYRWGWLRRLHQKPAKPPAAGAPGSAEGGAG